MKICAVETCDKPYHAHGYCSRHAYHFVTHGDPLGGRFSARPGEPLRWIKENSLYAGDDCLIYPFERDTYGYGIVKINGVKRVASRVMCEEVNGPPPVKTHQAAHSCGKGHEGCMTPRHLSWKTRSGNMQDAKEHGTWMHGEKVVFHKLTRNEVITIRALAPYMRQKDLAGIYGVTQGAISRAVNGGTWDWL